jgi:aminoglycoside phosphotransferase (APT) family kinase protein
VSGAAPGGPARRTPKIAPVRDEVRAALPKIVATHGGGHALDLAFPLPGGRREKVLLRLSGLDRPLVLRVYSPEETDLLDDGNVVVRALEARRTVPVGHCWTCVPPGRSAPFGYRIHDLVWGADLEKILFSGDIAARDLSEIGEALGGALAALHEIEACGWGAPRLPPTARAGEVSTFVRAEILCRIERAKAAGLIDEERARALLLFSDLVARKLDAAGIDGPRLVHGRFGPEAAIFRREGGRYALSGLVSLDLARFFDPQFDLVAAEEEIFAREPALRAPFLEAYAARAGGLPPPCDPERAALYQAMRALA